MTEEVSVALSGKTALGNGSCPHHGDYQYPIYDLLNLKIKTYTCPKCVEDKVAEQKEKEAEEKVAKVRGRRAQRCLDTGISKRNIGKTFANYHGTTDEQARNSEICRRYMEGFLAGSAPGNLVLTGQVGTGKTHLASAIVEGLIDTFHVKLVRTFEMIRTIKESWTSANFSERQAIGMFTEPDLLIVDEVGIQYNSATEKTLLFEVINGRYEKGLPTVLITNLNVQGLRDVLGEQAVDRLREDGLQTLVFDWESYRGSG